MPNLLVDYIGDWWEVLPESTIIPAQNGVWVRHQDAEMIAEAERRIAEHMTAHPEDDPHHVASDVWDAIYAERGHDRVWIQEIPHSGSSGQSQDLGARGIYELIAWDGIGVTPGLRSGAMIRMLVAPSARWYEEQAESAQQTIDRIDAGMAEVDAQIASAESDYQQAKTAKDKGAAATAAAGADTAKQQAIAERESAVAQRDHNLAVRDALRASGKTAARPWELV